MNCYWRLSPRGSSCGLRSFTGLWHRMDGWSSLDVIPIRTNSSSRGTWSLGIYTCTQITEELHLLSSKVHQRQVFLPYLPWKRLLFSPSVGLRLGTPKLSVLPGGSITIRSPNRLRLVSSCRLVLLWSEGRGTSSILTVWRWALHCCISLIMNRCRDGLSRRSSSRLRQEWRRSLWRWKEWGLRV